MVIKKFKVLVLILLSLAGCQNIKENLTLKKKQNVDEFMIEKRKPLVMPPDFSELPKPKNVDDKDSKNEDEELDLKLIFKKNNNTNDLKKSSSSNVEKSISDILKNK